MTLQEGLPDEARDTGRRLGGMEIWETPGWRYMVQPGTRKVLNVARRTLHELPEDWPNRRTSSDTDEPSPIDLVRELRAALGMFDGAMPVSPREAWQQAIEEVRQLRAMRATDSGDSYVPLGAADTCEGDRIPGVLAPMNSLSGVQRCDECRVYDGDLDAALALAATIPGAVVAFEDQHGKHRFFAGQLDDGVFIASGTDPWLEVGGRIVEWLPDGRHHLVDPDPDHYPRNGEPPDGP